MAHSNDLDQILLTHGISHLLGHTHDISTDSTAMHNHEAGLLEAYRRHVGLRRALGPLTVVLDE